MRKQFARTILIGALVALATSRVASAQVSPIPNSADPNAAVATGDLKFYGVSLNITLQDQSSLNRFNYSNSLYAMFEPNWALGRFAFPKSKTFNRLVVSARLPINYSLTGFDSTAAGGDSLGRPDTCSNLSSGGTVDPTQVERCDYRQSYRPYPSDFQLFIANPAIYTIPKIGFRVNPSVRFNFPVSYESRMNNMLFSAQAAVGVGRAFFGKLSVGYQLGATKVFNSTRAPMAQATGSDLANGAISNGYTFNDVRGNSDSFYSDPSRLIGVGGNNTNFALSHILSLGYGITDRLSISTMYLFQSAWAYSMPESCPANYGGMITDPCRNADTVANSQAGYNGEGTERTAIRNGQFFMLNAAYQLKDWVGLYASWTTFSPLRKPDNSWRQPFFSVDYNAFSSVNVGATFSMGYSP